MERLSLLDDGALERSAAADAVYEALRKAIVARQLQPPKDKKGSGGTGADACARGSFSAHGIGRGGRVAIRRL